MFGLGDREDVEGGKGGAGVPSKSETQPLMEAVNMISTELMSVQ